VLLPGGGESLGIGGALLRVEEAWMNAIPEVAETLRPALETLEERFGRAIGVRMLPEGLDTAYDHFRAVQAEEAWAALGDWVASTEVRFGPSIGERFAAARGMDPALAHAGRAFRRKMQTRVRAMLAGGAVLVYPTSPCPAPLLTASEEVQGELRAAVIGVTSIAGFAGAPEVTLPAGTVAGAPVGLSLTAAPGRDRALLAFAREAASVLNLPA